MGLSQSTAVNMLEMIGIGPFITIPAFGPHWRFTLIQGTALAQLDLSPGHVPGTQWPGQVGNFAVAGHRVMVSDGIYASSPTLDSAADGRTCCQSSGL